MINLVILLIFTTIVIVTIYDLALGYSLLVATLFLVPRVALMSSAISVTSKLSLVMLTVLVVVHFKEKKKYNLLPKSLTRPFLLYFASSLFLFIFSFAVPKGLQLRAYINELTFLTFSFSAYLIFDDVKKINKFLYTIVISTILVSAYAVFTYYIKFNPYLLVADIYYGNTENQFKVDGLEMVRGFVGSRLQSTFDHPLTLGQIFALVFCFLTLLKKKMSIIFYLLIPVITVIIFLTGSRSAIVSLLPSLLVLLYLFNWQTKILLVFLLLITILSLDNNVFQLSPEINRSLKASVFFWDSDLQRQAEYSGSSIEMRLYQLESVVKKLSRTNPFTGYGLGYREYNQAQIGGLDPDLLGYESVFFLKPVEQGLIGLFFLLFLILKMYTYFAKKINYLSRREKFLVQAYFLSYLIGITMTGMRVFSFMIFIILYMVYLRYIQIHTKEVYRKISKISNTV